jgi:hypothetical protein
LEESHPNELWDDQTDDHPDVLREESLNVMKRSKKTVAY